MRVLYHLWLSPFSRKVRVVLREKNLDFTLKTEKVWERRPEFLALSPAGEVPVLIEPDGTVLAGDRLSYLSVAPSWMPDLIPGQSRFTLSDLVNVAENGVPA